MTKYRNYDTTATKKIAEQIVECLRPGVERIEIAGSIRRNNKNTVHDIEIVCVPKITHETNLFGEAIPTSILGNHLTVICNNPGGAGVSWRFIKNGSKYKQFRLANGIMVDLYITSAGQWGLMFALRTGSKAFSKKLVKAKRYGGHMPSNYKVKGGWLWKINNHNDISVVGKETPDEQKPTFERIPVWEEADLFKIYGIDYVPPMDRG